MFITDRQMLWMLAYPWLVTLGTAIVWPSPLNACIHGCVAYWVGFLVASPARRDTIRTWLLRQFETG